MTRVDDVTDEYASSAERYFGPDQGRAWADSLRGKPMARIRIVPTWVNILDFETRFPERAVGLTLAIQRSERVACSACCRDSSRVRAHQVQVSA